MQKSTPINFLFWACLGVNGHSLGSVVSQYNTFPISLGTYLYIESPKRNFSSCDIFQSLSIIPKSILIVYLYSQLLQQALNLSSHKQSDAVFPL